MAWLLFIVVSESVSQSRWAAKTAGISYSDGVPAIAKAIAIAPQKKKKYTKQNKETKRKQKFKLMSRNRKAPHTRLANQMDKPLT